jgi:hypothetical protein
MDNNENRSTIKLNSNIMLKSRFEKDRYGYLPPELLPSHCSDKRVLYSLPKHQQEQFYKKLFYASQIVDE